MDKYLCLDCGGEGKVVIHGPEGHYTRGCLTCGGSGKRKITITLEEYESLKKLSKEIRPLTESEKLSMEIC